jgi:hypothetical protein
MQFTVAQQLPVYPFGRSSDAAKRPTFFAEDQSIPDGTVVDIDDELAFFMHNIVFFEYRNRYVCCSAVEFRRRARRVEVLSIFVRQKGSPESKRVLASHAKTAK